MGEIEVTIQSILSPNEPQGRFRLRLSTSTTVEHVLKQLCKDYGTPLKSDYSLLSKDHRTLNRTDTLAASEVRNGAMLYWSNDNVKIKAGGFSRFFCFISIVSLVIGVVGFITICVIKFHDFGPDHDYAIVFDAGSTHTSMYIYTWESSKFNGTAVAIQFGDKCTADGAGISDFENEPDKAGSTLQSCIDEATTAIPSSHHAITPVYLGATAGMRLLNESAGENILDSVRETLSKSPFLFTDPLTSARIISGSEEGSFSWITSNYVTNAFQVDRPGVTGFQALTIVPTIGALDLGGASTQITFVPDNDTVMQNNYKQELQLFGHNYTVYTHSYLCLGVKMVTKRLLACLVEKQKIEPIEHPCWPKGYSTTMTRSELFSGVCYSSSTGFLPAPIYTIEGTGSFMECKNAINFCLFRNRTCQYSSCSFNNVYQPPVTGPFYAFASFFYVSNFLKLVNNTSANFRRQDFQEKSDDFCKKTWDEIQQIPATKRERPNLLHYCTQSQYISTLLHDGYNFTDQMWNGISFVGQILGTDIGWTLGFVLNESGSYPINIKEVAMKTLTFALLMALFCLCLILSLTLAIEVRKVRSALSKSFRNQTNYGAI